MIHATSTSKKGFTLVELMLSMAFVSVLLLAILMTVIQMTRIYDKGISLKEVNQTGRALADDLTRTLSSATPFDLSDNNIYRVADSTNGPTGGRLCTGQASYIWNIGESVVNGSGVRFFKVKSDAEGVYCSIHPPSLPTGDLEAGVDLLREGNRDLMVHNFTIDRLGSSADDSTGQALYAVRFVIGVRDENNTMLESNSASCKPPDTAQRNEDFCAVNRFDLVIRAGKRDLVSGD